MVPNYCDEAFKAIIDYCKLGPEKKILEIGPGTGQATLPLLKTGCDYTRIDYVKIYIDSLRRSLENIKIVIL